MSNAEIADRLASLAQLLSAQKENPYKVKAYRRAAETIRMQGDSVDELVREGADLTAYEGIGSAISDAVREIVLSGTFGKLDKLRSEASPEMGAINEYPKLDPRRVLRIFKKLGISSIAELRQKLNSGEIGAELGVRMEQHVQQALSEKRQLLMSEADDVANALMIFLRRKCGVTRAEMAGEWRRRMEVVSGFTVLIETGDFAEATAKMKSFGGKAELLKSGESSALVRLASGIDVSIEGAESKNWGAALVRATGSDEHVRKLPALGKSKRSYPDEAALYRSMGLSYIEPELREGRDEVERAARGPMPALVTVEDVRGDLHAHTTSSDGAHSLEEMAAGARSRGYEYLGITDHSQSLKIAGGLTEDRLWEQIRRIDKLNGKLNRKKSGIYILKSAEVDILEDGSLDYPDELLRELDYTVCSIHSRFGLDTKKQTERLLRAMDNRYFTILGHATGRKLLKRPGYEIDVDRVIAHAKKNGCFFEINSNPNRLDMSSANARLVREAGIKIAINTDAHNLREFEFIEYGVSQARRAGLEKTAILNCSTWAELRRAIKR